STAMRGKFGIDECMVGKNAAMRGKFGIDERMMWQKYGDERGIWHTCVHGGAGDAKRRRQRPLDYFCADWLASCGGASSDKIVLQNMQRSVLPIILVCLPHSGHSIMTADVDIMPAQK